MNLIGIQLFWVVSAFFLIGVVNSAIVSLFKHHYVVVPERAELTNINKSLVEANLCLYIYNRTTKPLNATFRLLTNLDDSSTVSVAGYQFKSNEYRLTAAQFSFKLRHVIAGKIDIFGIDTLFEELTVPPLEWPLQKNVTYRITNWLPDTSKFPSFYAPDGKWKGLLTFYSDNKVTKLADLSYYFNVKDVPDV